MGNERSVTMGSSTKLSGDDMSLQLCDADRRAVDLLFDQQGASNAYVNGPGLLASHVSSDASLLSDAPPTESFGTLALADVGARLQEVERLVGLLDVLPVSDPPADLVSRTLGRIEESSTVRITGPTPQTSTTLVHPRV